MAKRMKRKELVRELRAARSEVTRLECQNEIDDMNHACERAMLEDENRGLRSENMQLSADLRSNERHLAVQTRNLSAARKQRDEANDAKNTAITMLAHVVEQVGGTVLVTEEQAEAGPADLEVQVVQGVALFQTSRPVEVEIEVEVEIAPQATAVPSWVEAIFDQAFGPRL